MAVNAQDIIAAIDADEFLQAGFEVIISNSKNNDTQTITGYAVDSDGDLDEAFAGGLYVQYSPTDNIGYAEHGIKNINSPFMALATEGIVEGMPGDHTGIYACNTHDVNKLSDGGNIVINFPGKTLGLITPKGERADYIELIVGEKYKFGYICFASDSFDIGDNLLIENGVWRPLEQNEEIEGGTVYGRVEEIRNFNEGAALGTYGAILRIMRKAGSPDLPTPTAEDAGKIMIVNEEGDWELGDVPEELPDVTAADDNKGIFVENGEWTLKDVPYTETTVLFSGNAEVEEI